MKKRNLIITILALVATLSMVGCGANDTNETVVSDKTEYSETVVESVEDDKTDSDINTDVSEPVDDNTSEKPSDDVSDNADSSEPSVPEKPETDTVDVSESAYNDYYNSFITLYNDEINRYSHDVLTLLVKMGTVSSTYDIFNDEYIPDSEIQPLITNAGYAGDIADFTNAYSDDILYPSIYFNYCTILSDPNLASVLNSEFDADYYATQYPDDAAFCAQYDLSLETYYGVYGVFTGQSMSADFNLETYKTNRPELVDAFGDCNINYYIYYLENIETERDLANPNK